MAKKAKAHKKRTHKKTRPASRPPAGAFDIPDQDQGAGPFAGNPAHGSLGGYHGGLSDAYADGYAGASAARSPGAGGNPQHSPRSYLYADDTQRRRQRSAVAPLTDRNLQTLLEQNRPHGPGRTAAVALDMERYARESAFPGYASDGDADSVYSRASQQSSLEFGQSNPSSEHSSDSTSLDDVCFPDYYEAGRDDAADAAQVWPDTSVLHEFILEELDDMRDDLAADVAAGAGAGVNFHSPVARKVSDSRSAAHTPQQPAPSPYSPLASPPVTRSHFNSAGDDHASAEDTPLLNSVRVNESPSIRSGESSLRVRPKAIQPWEKSQDRVTPVGRKSDTFYRFTYFREDMANTIHAATLPGLVTDNDAGAGGDTASDDIRSKLESFFPHQHRHHMHSTPPEAPAAASTSTATGSSSVPALPLPAITASRGPSRAESVNPPSVPPTVANSDILEKKTAPFWLDVLDPTEEEMKVLSKTFGIHPLTTEDIFLGETREKVELFRQYYFICFTSFDIVYERRKQRAMEHEKKMSKMSEYDSESHYTEKNGGLLRKFGKLLGADGSKGHASSKLSVGSSTISKNRRIRSGELCPLNMYMIIFEHGVLTFHFSATPHPINVRRRARMLKDHLTMSTDWICYALIDDITDSFAPMIDSIEQEVYLIEDEIMKMHSGDASYDSESDDSDTDAEMVEERHMKHHTNDVFYRRQRSKSVVDANPPLSQFIRNRKSRGSGAEYVSIGSGRSARSRTTTSVSSKSTSSRIVAWKRKGDMLRRIGECRKRVMSVMRLLGSKADVIKGFSKRFNENESLSLPKGHQNSRSASRQEILMYLGDIQDHIITMVQSLNHYEKLLARSHSNYLAQINIDMTRVNNDTNDILGKVTILGTIVLPINVVTGLWGMNCIVPGQFHDGLTWFYGILLGITMFSVASYVYARKVTGL